MNTVKKVAYIFKHTVGYVIAYWVLYMVFVWPRTDEGRAYIALEHKYDPPLTFAQGIGIDIFVFLFFACLIIGAVRTLRDKLRARRERLSLLEQIRQARARQI